MRSNRGADRASGAVVVEFALVALLLFGLIFGIVDFGSTYNSYQSLRQGARDAARAAVVDRYPSSGACSTGTSDQKLACLVDERAGLDPQRSYVLVDAIDSDGAGATDRGSIKVCVQFRNESITGFFPMLEDRWLRTRVEMRNEVGNTPAVGDQADALPSGGSWGWC